MTMTYKQWLDTSAQYDWWVWVYNDATERALDTYGMRIGHIYEGSQNNTTLQTRADLLEYMRLTGLCVSHPALYALACGNESSYIEVDKNRVSIDVDVDKPVGMFEGLDPHTWGELVMADVNAVEGHVEEVVRAICAEINASLGEELGYITSRKAFKEWHESAY